MRDNTPTAWPPAPTGEPETPKPPATSRAGKISLGLALALLPVFALWLWWVNTSRLDMIAQPFNESVAGLLAWCIAAIVFGVMSGKAWQGRAGLVIAGCMLAVVLYMANSYVVPG